MKFAPILSLACLGSVAAIGDVFFFKCESLVARSPTIKDACVLDLSDEETAYEKYYTCLCPREDMYLSSMDCVNKLSERANAMGILPNMEKARRISDKTGRHFCKRYYGINLAMTFEEGQEYLRSHSLPSLEEAMKNGGGPFVVPNKTLTDAEIQSSVDQHFQQTSPDRFGQITLYYVFAIFGLQIILNFLGWLLPSLIRIGSNNVVGRFARKHFFLPALFHKKRAMPSMALPGLYFSFPPRMHSVLIFFFYLISTVLMSYNYPVLLTPLGYQERHVYIGIWLGWRSGIMAMYCMPLLWLFAARNNFLIWLTGWQYEVFQHWHRWISRLFIIEVMIHTIAWTVEEKDDLAEAWTQGYWVWGFIATFFMFAMWFQAMKVFRKLAYDLFVFLHVLFGVFVIVGTYYHLLRVDQCFEELYTCIAIWGFDRLARIARIVLANPTKTRATLIAHEGDVLELTIPYSKLWKLRAGNYIFVHFWDPLRFWQSHPFTVMEPAKAEEEGTIKLYAKARGGMTKRMYELVLREGKPLQHRVFLDGPYGVEFNIKPFKETVLVAGGIGITAVYSHLISYAHKLPDHTFYVHWVMLDELPLRWFQHEIAKMEALSNVKLVLYIDGPGNSLRCSENPEKTSSDGSLPGDKNEALLKTGSINSGIDKYWMRPNFVDIVSNHLTHSQGPICVFVCGPDVISDEVRFATSQGISLTKNFVQFYEESFTM